MFKGFEDHKLVNTDQKRLQQVLLNLYSNAIKFTQKHGKITILIEKLQMFVRISVIDKGLGIKLEDQGKMFKLFSSIKDQKRKVNLKGIGLGLVISKMIVKKFNGMIDFISEYEKGTTFYYTFETEDFDLELYLQNQKNDDQQFE